MVVKDNNSFLLQTSNGPYYVAIAELIRIEALSNYSKLYFNNGKTLVVAKVLRWFDNALLQDGFIRIHRSHLVNSHFIKKYNENKIGHVQLYDGMLLKIARRKRINFLNNFA